MGEVTAGFTLHNLAQLALYRGDWETAREYEERALVLMRSSGMVFRSIYPAIFLGQLTLWEGDWDEAYRLLQESVGLAERFGDLQALRYGHRALAEREILTGDAAAAVHRLDPFLDRTGLEETDVTFLLPILTWAYLESGDSSRALELSERSVERARRQQYALALVDALWVHGAVLASLNGRDEAARAFEEAVDQARRIPYPYGEGRALMHWGEMLLAAGDVENAERRLRAAQDIFTRLGAQRDSDAVERTLLMS
jgi:tetratricopeptide (TPR) repeat protein